MIYTNIATRYDELVSPHTSSFLTGPNVTNITPAGPLRARLQRPPLDHLEPDHRPHILNALDPAHAKPVACTPVLPAA